MKITDKYWESHGRRWQRIILRKQVGRKDGHHLEPGVGSEVIRDIKYPINNSETSKLKLKELYCKHISDIYFKEFKANIMFVLLLYTSHVPWQSSCIDWATCCSLTSAVLTPSRHFVLYVHRKPSKLPQRLSRQIVPWHRRWDPMTTF